MIRTRLPEWVRNTFNSKKRKTQKHWLLYEHRQLHKAVRQTPSFGLSTFYAVFMPTMKSTLHISGNKVEKGDGAASPGPLPGPIVQDSITCPLLAARRLAIKAQPLEVRDKGDGGWSESFTVLAAGGL